MVVFRAMRPSKQIQRYLSLVLLLVLAAACAPQEPVIIRITPTHAPTNTPDSATLTPTILLPSASPTEIAETASPSPTTTITTASESAIPFGPIIDQSYQLPPTSTPRPTSTPELLPTESVVPAATPLTTPLGPLGILEPERMGIQMYYNVDIDTWYTYVQLLRPLRMGWVKMQADWSFLQPDNPQQFDQNFRLFELHVQRARNEGYKILLSVAKAPAWARASTQNEAGPPDDPQLYVNFLRFLLEKMGDDIDAIEIWNEPNLAREWQTALPFSGTGYMQLFDAAYTAIREYSSSIVVVTAGLAPTSTTDYSVDDREFLRQMYSAGLGRYTDVAIGTHPFAWGNPPDQRCCNAVEGRGWDDDPHFFFLHNLEEIREIMVRNGHQNNQIWVTEFGWATWEGFPTEAPEPWMTYNSPAQQADYTMRAFQLGFELGYVGNMFLWNFNFANQALIENRVELAGYSLLYPDLRAENALRQRPLYERLASRP